MRSNPFQRHGSISSESSNDALRKHGILPPREPTPTSPSPPSSPTLDDVLNEFDFDDLQELADDAPDDETERMIAMHRKKRLQEERRDQARARFGRVYPIGREDYMREVTEASKANEEDDDNERGTGVVCFLYKDGYVFILLLRPGAEHFVEQ